MLAELYALAPEAAFRAGTVVLAAHPDDETIGAGGLLRHLPNVAVAHVTDGAPRERRWWGAPHLPTRADYARLRAEELARALDLACVPRDRRRSLGREDQRASLDLAGLARDVADLLADLRPGVVLTHAYEGGHPDHDAAAFAARAARDLMMQRGADPPVLLEFTSYFARGDGIATGNFLPSASDVVAIELSDGDRERKRRMMACFASQAETLRPFAADVERFRVAPEHDFARAPHGGRLHYERFEWGTTGAEWRARAAAALDALGLVEAARC
jgi:N-acetylglucosamine malate deacetylase 2